MRSVLWALLLALNGCAGVAQLAETLQAREVRSCLRYEVTTSGQWTGTHSRVMGITATGGVAMEDCIAVHQGGFP